MSSLAFHWFNKVLGGQGEGGIELLLADAIQVPEYFTNTSPLGNMIVGVPDGAVVKKIFQTTNISVAGNSLSMHEEKTDTDYQTPSTGTTKIILVVAGNFGGTDTKFKVWDHTVADTTPTGTPEYDFTQLQLDTNQRQTTDIMTGFGPSRFVNVELESGDGIDIVEGWAIEIPA